MENLKLNNDTKEKEINNLQNKINIQIKDLYKH